MGKIWLETSDGRLIHLPVVGDDVNSCTDAIRIPASVIVNQDRCYSQPIVIVTPQLGQVTIDLRPTGIIGSCNQCGMCCGHPVSDCPNPPDCGYILHEDLNWHVCQYLVIDKWRKWGDPNNSSCSLYQDILDYFKGCAYPPDEITPWMSSCGYSEV